MPQTQPNSGSYAQIHLSNPTEYQWRLMNPIWLHVDLGFFLMEVRCATSLECYMTTIPGWMEIPVRFCQVSRQSVITTQSRFLLVREVRVPQDYKNNLIPTRLTRTTHMNPTFQPLSPTSRESRASHESSVGPPPKDPHQSSPSFHSNNSLTLRSSITPSLYRR